MGERSPRRPRGIAKKTAALLRHRALVKKGSELFETSVDELKVGDLIVVKPGWRIPIDGLVEGGRRSLCVCGSLGAGTRI